MLGLQGLTCACFLSSRKYVHLWCLFPWDVSFNVSGESGWGVRVCGAAFVIFLATAAVT